MTAAVMMKVYEAMILISRRGGGDVLGGTITVRVLGDVRSDIRALVLGVVWSNMSPERRSSLAGMGGVPPLTKIGKPVVVVVVLLFNTPSTIFYMQGRARFGRQLGITMTLDLDEGCLVGRLLSRYSTVNTGFTMLHPALLPASAV